MRRVLMRAALLGALALAGVGVGGTSAMAQNCIGAGGGTDCPLTPGVPQFAQPGAGGNPSINNPPPAYNPGWNGDRRFYRQRWRNGWNRGSHVYVDRYVPVYPPSYYYDDDYYDDDYYDRPRYRVAPRRSALYLSEEHVEWCHNRYRTYRASDNTYKPTRNTRRQCVSPYS
jgi:hypothetical protein